MPDISKLIVFFILGVVEGITEFLPISSTGHVVLIEKFLNYSYDSTQIFIVIAQLGAILSALVTFRKRLYNMSINYVFNFFTKQYYVGNCFRIQHIFVGTLPGVIIGMCFYEKIRLLFFDPIHIVYGLLAGGILLLISEWYFSTTSSECISSIDNISYYKAFLIGCFQCLAFWPGFSRSGSTIGGGLLVGLNRQVASEFSFFLAIPIILGSTVLTVYYQKFDVEGINIIICIVGFVSAFVTALGTINFFLKIVRNISLIPFVIYRLLLAIVVYCWIYNDYIMNLVTCF